MSCDHSIVALHAQRNEGKQNCLLASFNLLHRLIAAAHPFAIGALVPLLPLFSFHRTLSQSHSLPQLQSPHNSLILASSWTLLLIYRHLCLLIPFSSPPHSCAHQVLSMLPSLISVTSVSVATSTIPVRTSSLP